MAKDSRNEPASAGSAATNSAGVPVRDAKRRGRAQLDDIRSYAEARCAAPTLSSVLAKGRLRGGEVAALLSGAEQSGGKVLYAVRVLNDLESGALPPDRLKALPPAWTRIISTRSSVAFRGRMGYEPLGAPFESTAFAPRVTFASPTCAV